ncbi:hypothetical protein EPA93_02610 [Ktedonosporobacter rubrisoli]|uniref:DUF3159 domain-containing protein n=1 Tax=Ktedonosporobacter rubrisoli TaxID=2509675 RepID=A0A4P6JIP5_KTERU|nr:VC0807 family protein [Ktedonosporobacter rubrisoli]QBD74939.1 hypothetical protein EPA93_02610 [Ktedonosporobacter rubrisoli]
MTPSPAPVNPKSGTAQPIQSPSFRTLMTSLLPSILLNGVLVLVVYQLAKHFTSASDVNALLLSALPALIGTIISLIRQHRVDVLGAFSLVTIAVSLGLSFMTGDARLLLIRESFLTMLFGIICLISLLFQKPVWYYIIGYFITGNNREQMAAYDGAWREFSAFRIYIRNVTILWGVIYVVEFLIRLVLIYTLSIPLVLLISPFLLTGLTVLASGITFLYGQSLGKLRDTEQQANSDKANDERVRDKEGA